MKKILSFVMFLSLFAFAEITPEFQAFAPNFMKLDKVVKGYHDFTLKVDVAPWSFVYKGQVKAPNGDPYLLYDGIDAGDVFIVIAYVPAPVQGPEGDEYQAGIFDIMIYYTDGSEELAATIKNASVELLPPLSADQWAKESMDAAKSAGEVIGTIWTDSKYAKAITVASADPLDKDKLLAAKKAKKEKQKKALEEKRAREAALTAEEDDKRPNKSKMAREQAKRDSIAAVKKAAKKRKAITEDDENLTPKERKKLAVKARKAKRQKAAIVENEVKEDNAEAPAPVVKKKKKKKKKVVVEDEYNDEE